MASACVNNIGLSPESLLDCSPAYPSYGWLSAQDASKAKRIPSRAKELSDLAGESDLKEFGGFEFRLEDPVMMLPADELFFDGKLVPQQLSVVRQEVATSTATTPSGVSSPDTPNSRRRSDDVFATDPYLLSPRAPRCSSRWKELLGFRKLQQNSSIAKHDNNKRTSSSTAAASSHNGNGATRSIRQLLHRSSKSSNDSSINLPLLKDTDNESVSVSSRPSLSSSSSGHDLDDLPRLSLDSDKPGKVNLNTNPNNRPKVRTVKTRTRSTELRTTTRVGRSPMRRPADSTVTTVRGVSVDSPRMNSSGKIVFHSLERSSSSPSSFNGGPRFKHRGMERSYSANVRVTPVLNVPVCSLRGSSKSGGVFGFPIFSSQHKRDGSVAGANRSQQFTGRTRTDCS